MKALITDYGFPDVSQEKDILARAGIAVETAQCKKPDDVIAAAHGADALLVQWAPITRNVIAALDQCKIIVRYGIGVDNVDLQAAGERGIPVCNIPDYCIGEVADHSLSLALSLARQLPQTDAAVRTGAWKIIPPSPFPAFRDTLLVTVGFGRIARAVLARARPFGFQLAAYDPYVEEAVFIAAGIRKLDRYELFREAGILSLHLPLTSETRHLVDRDSLALMKRDSIVVNTARGGLIDTMALAQALIAGKIAGAGIDVFEEEPLPGDHPLRTAPNVLLTSHTAWYSAGSIPILQRKAAEEVVRGLKHQPLQNVANRKFLVST
jgi:D-3-phosphoglycerate dehydrogenase